MKTNKILITGGLGFIGSSLAREYINKGYEVTIITKTLDKITNIKDIKDKIEIIVSDIRYLEENLESYEYVIHCASTVHNYNILSNPYLDIETNCIGTVKLLELLKTSKKLKKLIYVSTFFVNKGEPKALYGATKLCTEHICKTYNRVYNIPISIVRLTNIFGPGEQCDNNKKAAFNRMIQLAINDETIKLYNNGNIFRDYLYIEDAVSGIDTILNKGKSGEVYELGKGYSLLFREMIEDIIELAKGGKIISVTPPEFHNQVGIDNYFCDIHKLNMLGWYPKWTVRDGIKKTIEVYNEKH